MDRSARGIRSTSRRCLLLLPFASAASEEGEKLHSHLLKLLVTAALRRYIVFCNAEYLYHGLTAPRSAPNCDIPGFNHGSSATQRYYLGQGRI